MSNASVDSLVEAAAPIALPQDPTMASPPYNEQPPKLKGRRRLLAGLQRISSSPSVHRLAASSRSRAYGGNGQGSVSCMSLNSSASMSPPSLGVSLRREFSAGYSTAPTSTPTTPGIQEPFSNERTRVRYLSNLDGRTSAPLPSDLRPSTRSGATPGIAEVDDDYFSRASPASPPVRRDFNFWRDLPSELKMEVLTYLKPREIVRCSLVSRSWHKMCFDGQLWSILDTAGFYQDIPADALVKIITHAGPFVRDLNLRGCVQLRERWHAKGLSDACTNLENFSLEGCRIDRTSIHNFLYSNNRLVHMNLSGLAGATNAAMKIIAAHCPKLEHLNISWCNNIDTRGLGKVIEACTNLKDLRAGEIRGWDDIDIMQRIFARNTLERLVLMHCDSLTDDALIVLMEGMGGEIDYLTGRPIVPPRKLKHLDLTRCRTITDRGMRSFVNNLPEIEGLQLSKCHGVVDATLTDLLPTTPMLTHLDLEEVEGLTNAVLQSLAAAPCASRLRHLGISYCENLGDSGMIPVLKTCTNLRSLDMDNTRISDLVLTEAAAMMRQRTARTLLPNKAPFQPAVGLRLVAYDCQNVTWTGVREVLSRNSEVFVTTHATELPPLGKNLPAHPLLVGDAPSRPPSPARIHITRTASYPSEVIQLKCFYTYQPTVEEHTKRVLRGDFAAARRLERKWVEFMMAQEEAGAGGAGHGRRRRRAREAQMMHADEADDGLVTVPGLGVGGGRRRRARSGGCAVM